MRGRMLLPARANYEDLSNERRHRTRTYHIPLLGGAGRCYFGRSNWEALGP